MIEFAREDRTHGARDAVDDVARASLLLEVFVHARGEDALFGARGFAVAVGGFKELRQLRAAPEAGFEFVRLTRRARDHDGLAEDHGPAQKREENQDRQNDLHDGTRLGDERQKGEVGDGIHGGISQKNEW